MSDASASIAARLAQTFGVANVVTGTTELAAYEVDGMRPAAAVMAASVEKIAELLRFAAADKLAVIPCGRRTKLGIGAPPNQYDIALDLSRMNHVLAYEPRDLTLGVEPGMPFAALAETLAAEKQFLPLSPPFAGRATIGGILAADSASPVRYAYGGPRDFVLGMEFVSGDGTIAKSGGRVVKNVSGYDLHKLLIGPLGTLAVITRANFKTFPLPPAHATFISQFDSAGAAMEFCKAVRKSALEPRLVEVISQQAAKLIATTQMETNRPADLSETGWNVAITAAGTERVVARHARELASLAAQGKAREFVAVDGESEAALRKRLCEFPALALAANMNTVIFRIAALPAAMASLSERLAAEADGAQMEHAIVLRPHGLVYFALLPSRGVGVDIPQIARVAEAVFHVAAEAGAKARIEFAPVELKRMINVWGVARPDFELMQRVKKVFDPGGVLSPGRFAGEI